MAGGDIGSWGLFGGVLFGAAFLADFVGGDEEERDEGHGKEQDGGDAGKLLHFAVEQGQSGEDEEQMRAEDLEVRLCRG